MSMNDQIRREAERLRLALGLSQQELAERAGVRQATVSRLLAGERMGEPETWQRILKVLGLELAAVPAGEGSTKGA